MVGRLRNRIFLPMGTQTFIQLGAGSGELVTARATALIAILHTAGCSIISGGDQAFVFNDDGRDFSFDAVGAKRDDFGDP